jgi:hypothetical protein
MILLEIFVPRRLGNRVAAARADVGGRSLPDDVRTPRGLNLPG